MQLTLTSIAPRARDEFEPFVAAYLAKIASFAQAQSQAFKSESAWLEWLDRQRSRTTPALVVLDSRGQQMTSEGFAEWLGSRRDQGVQHVIFAIGPADGWSPAASARAQLLLSFGPMTLAHSLARLVLAEQIYRAFAILTGHPYHAGH